MLNKFEDYRFEGEMQKLAMLKLQHAQSLKPGEKEQLQDAFKYGKRLGMGIQLPFVLGAMYYFSKVVPKFSPEFKMISYTVAIGGYGFFYMFTKAWAWHYAYSSVENVVKEYVLKADLEELKRIHDEQFLGISKDMNVYVPGDKKDNKPN